MCRLQQAANQAVDRGLRRVDKRRGFRKPRRNVIAEGQTIDGFKRDRWARRIGEATSCRPWCAASTDTTALAAHRRSSAPTLTRAGMQWTNKQVADGHRQARRPDRRRDHARSTAAPPPSPLEQTPLLEGALVAIDNHTGQVLAMVGGYSFARSKFNRATQAYRQMGSTVKPILYTAAIDRGLTPTTILVDEPTTFDAGAGQPPYAPRNYDRKFMGPMTLRHALEQSRNIPSVKVIDMLGPTQVAAYAKKFGFAQDFRPFLSMALGAQEVTLMEITSAYSAFPNHGIRMEPYLAEAINDRDGSLLEERRPQPKDAIRADTAYVHDQPDAGRRAARHRGGGERAQLAAGRQDRHRGRQHRRVVRRLRSQHHRRRLDGQRREEADRRERDRHHRGAADVDRLHEGLHRPLRRPREPARVRIARQHRVHAGGPQHRRTGLPKAPARSSTKRSSPARSRSGR